MERVKLREYIEEILNYTLNSHINNKTLNFNLGLSKQFCSNLLLHDQDASFSLPTDCIEGGVPRYPLYKRLASVLYHCLATGVLSRTMYKEMPLICEDVSVKQKQEQWSELIMDKGIEFVNVLKRVEFELHVEEPCFELLRDGLKTIEARCAFDDYDRTGPGDIVLVNKCMAFEVQYVRHYASFSDMLEAESVVKVLPGVITIEEGVQIYRMLYTEEKERSKGVLAISVSCLTAQPCMSLASILSGLSYAGIQSLLGLVHTTGTILDALPPPRSILISSFVVPYKPSVQGSTLSHGARALAKHADRSSSKYWGNFTGNDSNKNKLAADIIHHLIASCCWLNVHVVQPHGIVFEIRTADGYGARWSNDGCRFIGFLEPYMDDGHSKRWKH
ncbi:hypothetical protein ACFE04_005880 [Oxalis oulophora]